MENHHFKWENPLKIAIFNSYVSHYQRVLYLPWQTLQALRTEPSPDGAALAKATGSTPGCPSWGGKTSAGSDWLICSVTPYVDYIMLHFASFWDPPFQETSILGLPAYFIIFTVLSTWVYLILANRCKWGMFNLHWHFDEAKPSTNQLNILIQPGTKHGSVANTKPNESNSLTKKMFPIDPYWVLP